MTINRENTPIKPSQVSVPTSITGSERILGTRLGANPKTIAIPTSLLATLAPVTISVSIPPYFQTLTGSVGTLTATSTDLAFAIVGDGNAISTSLTNTSLTVYHNISGVSANTYGTSTLVPQITVDARGHITNVALVTAPAAVANTFANVSSSSGTATATGADTLDVRGGGIVQTSITGNVLTVSVAQFVETARNIWATISASTGSATADVSADNLAIRGDSSGAISTSITGDVLTVFHNSLVSVGGTTSIYGTSTIIPRITINAQGHIVSVVPVTLPNFLLTETARNIWAVISASSGSTTADVSADNLAVRGDGTVISTSITGDVLTIFPVTAVSVGGVTSIYGTSTIIPRITVNQFGQIVSITNVTAPAAGGAQNIWATISASSGFTTANSTTDTLNIFGGKGISTSITGDNLTIELISAANTAYILHAEPSIAIGIGASVGAAGAIAIGESSEVSSTSDNAVAIGPFAKVLVGGSGVALGASALVSGASGAAIGPSTEAIDNAVAVGYAAKAYASNGLALGSFSNVDVGASAAAAIGSEAYTTVPHQIKLGKNNTSHVKAGGGIHFGTRSVSAGGTIQVTAGDGVIFVNTTAVGGQTVLQLPTPNGVLGQVLTIYYNTSAASASFPKVHTSVSATEMMIAQASLFASITFSELNQFIVLQAAASNRWAVIGHGGPTISPLSGSTGAETPRFIWSTVSASSGSATADVSADSLAIRGDGTVISTSITGDVLTIFPLAVVSVGATPSIYGTSTVIPRITVNQFGQIVSITNVTAAAGGGGITSVSCSTSSFTGTNLDIRGAGIINTDITGGVLTITGTETARNIWATISASSGSAVADVSADNLAVRGDGTYISTSITGDVLTIYHLPTGASVGSYGTSTEIPVITVGANGVITAVSRVTAPAAGLTLILDTSVCVTTTLSYAGVFSADYRNYVLVINNLAANSAGGEFLQIGFSSAGGTYRTANHGSRIVRESATALSVTQSLSLAFFRVCNNINGAVSSAFNGKFEIANPFDATLKKSIAGFGALVSLNNVPKGFTSYATNNQDGGSATGFQIWLGSAQRFADRGSIKLYGEK